MLEELDQLRSASLEGAAAELETLPATAAWLKLLGLWGLGFWV